MFELKCDSCEKEIRDPLKENIINYEHIDIFWYLNNIFTFSPSCNLQLFPCNNCFHMLVFQKENITCSICGYLNILAEKTRNFLGLSKYSLGNDQVRMLQRLTNEKSYINIKSDETQDNNHKFIIKKQLDAFTDPIIAQQDFLELSKKLSYDPNKNFFNISHLKMLSSLYEKEELQILSQTQEFFKNQSTLIELKKEYHLNEIASRNTLDITIKKLLESQTQEIKQEWEEKSFCYWNILCEINKIRFSLIEQIQDVDQYHLFSDKPFEKDFINPEVVRDQTIAEKIQLWGLLYQTISNLIN